ncbi:cytoplasmic dynein 2 intermediate chain 2-like [Penaeus japonicus]|uniref:cytoplasmic dynein 2 intermediate chain 2-like n=1 Tax=Penaeus japonicus TaxID=27405 RepID=UPI001C70F43B|nr:cytoplasmic dynein 2 intermediate chain 2-like [Penaeus japonicus]
MFSKHSETPVSFESSWKTEQQLAEGGTQTDEVGQEEAECQVVSLIETGVQTEEEDPPNFDNREYDEASLAAFLQRITPKVLQELDRQNRSRAFDGFSLMREEETSQVKLLHTLKWSNRQTEGFVSGIDWSCTGSVIAVAYGWSSHDDWCDHKSAVAVWNINRSDFDANQPERVIDVSSCVASLAFHPTNPAVFAIGTFSGEVLVYDLVNVEDVVPMATGECGGGSVTTLSWVDSAIGRVSATRSSSTLVATTSTGYILEWTFNITKQQLQLKSGFMLQGQEVPRSIRTQVDESSGVGIATASFNSEDTTLFVLGAEVGGMFLCSTTREVPTGVEFAGIGLNKCVSSVLAPHTGRVMTSECSPHHRNAILSAASDNEIRLYSLLQPNKPVSVIYSEENISCAHWSLSRPLVTAVGLMTGQVVLYDFGLKNCEPFLTLPAAEKPSPITTTAFNKKNMALIAVGDQLGRVSIWQLPNSAVSPNSTELATLFTLLGNLTE